MDAIDNALLDQIADMHAEVERLTPQHNELGRQIEMMLITRNNAVMALQCLRGKLPSTADESDLRHILREAEQRRLDRIAQIEAPAESGRRTGEGES